MYAKRERFRTAAFLSLHLKWKIRRVLFLIRVDSYSGGKGAGDLSLSYEAIEALGFLIAGSVDRNRYAVYVKAPNDLKWK